MYLSVLCVFLFFCFFFFVFFSSCTMFRFGVLKISFGFSIIGLFFCYIKYIVLLILHCRFFIKPNCNKQCGRLVGFCFMFVSFYSIFSCGLGCWCFVHGNFNKFWTEQACNAISSVMSILSDRFISIFSFFSPSPGRIYKVWQCVNMS